MRSEEHPGYHKRALDADEDDDALESNLPTVANEFD